MLICVQIETVHLYVKLSMKELF